MAAPHIKPSHQGRLHRNLGVPQGQRIPAATLEAASHSTSAAIRKQAAFAKAARSWNH
jgi:hypothetical protein